MTGTSTSRIGSEWQWYMFKTLFQRNLSLQIGDRTVRFVGVQDFEFALASRTEVPANKVAELIQLTPDELLKEAGKIREAEKRFVDLVAKSLETPGSIGHLLRQGEAKQFSQDHEWRDIMRALVEQGARFNEFKQVAVVKYVQYLGSRQDVLKSLYAKQDNLPRPAAPDLNATAGLDMKQTLIFDVADITPLTTPDTESFARVPRGETVAIDMAAGEEMDLILSRHRFKLVADDTAHLTDDSGKHYPLGKGRNHIGRQPGNDVVVEFSYRDVSRRHLVIEVSENRHFEVTDLSSHGTFIPSSRLEPTIRPMIRP